MSRQSFKDKFQKKYSREIVTPDPAHPRPVNVIPTGILALDYASGIGGFPRGKVVEVFGPESGGKSLMCLSALAFAQRTMGATGLYFDIEGGTPETWMATLGLDLSKTDVVQGDLSAEQNFDVLTEAITDGDYDYIIIDSVAALLPGVEQEGSVDQNYMGTLARPMSTGLKKICNTLASVLVEGKKAPCVIFINQIRHKIGVMFGDPETTPGGNALKFYSAQRYRVSRSGGAAGEHKVGGELKGHDIKVKNKKNKLGVPHRDGQFSVYYDQGVDPVKSIMEWLKEQKAYTKSKSGYDLAFTGLEGTYTFSKVEDIKDRLVSDINFQYTVYKAILSRYITVETSTETDSNESDDEE